MITMVFIWSYTEYVLPMQAIDTVMIIQTPSPAALYNKTTITNHMIMCLLIYNFSAGLNFPQAINGSKFTIFHLRSI